VGGVVWSTAGITFGASLLLVPVGVGLTVVAARRSSRDTILWVAMLVNTIDVLTLVAFVAEAPFS
jgi:putative effector of murein hydrolase LrgA (UPF0299 family)